MFWGLLLIIGIISAGAIQIYASKGNKSANTLFRIFLIMIIIGGTVFMFQGIIGITDYPYLTGERAKITALQKRLVDIKNADYDYKDYDYKLEALKEGKFVAGSIENYQQSTNLSNYIAELAKREANYNGYLERAKLYEKEFLLRFFGPGWAISNRVNNL